MLSRLITLLEDVRAALGVTQSAQKTALQSNQSTMSAMKAKLAELTKKSMAGRTSATKIKAEGKNWIAGATKHKGALHRKLGVPMGQKIPVKMINKAAKAGGKLGKEGRLAQTLKGLRK